MIGGEGAPEDTLGQELAVFSEGDEQHTVEELLRGGEHPRGLHGGVVAAQVGEERHPQAPIVGVERIRDLALLLFAGDEELIKAALTAALVGEQALAAEQKHEAGEGVGILRQLGEEEPLVEVLRLGAAIQAQLAEVGDEDPPRRAHPVGVVPGLLNRRHRPTAGLIKPLRGAFGLDDGVNPGDAAGREPADGAVHGALALVGLALHVDVPDVRRCAVLQEVVAQDPGEDGDEVGAVDADLAAAVEGARLEILHPRQQERPASVEVRRDRRGAYGLLDRGRVKESELSDGHRGGSER